MGHFRPKKRPFLGTFFNQVVDYEKITQKTNGCHQRIARELNFLGNRFLVPIASSNHVPERPKVASFQSGRFDTCFQPSVFARNICFQGLKMQSLNWARPKKCKKNFLTQITPLKNLPRRLKVASRKKAFFGWKKFLKRKPWSYHVRNKLLVRVDCPGPEIYGKLVSELKPFTQKSEMAPQSGRFFEKTPNSLKP